MTNELKNLGVLVTRPAHQTQSLLAQINTLGGRAISFPTIEIADVADQETLQAQLQELESYQLAIFISPNAVLKSIPKLREIWPTWPPQVKIAAIGISTVENLRFHHLAVDYYPHDAYNSEGLLALPALRNVAGMKIIVFRGEGGRRLLVTTLRDRGADVTEVVAYRRILPKIPKILPFAHNEIDIIVSTSNTGLQNLMAMCGEMDRSWLRNIVIISS